MHNQYLSPRPPRQRRAQQRSAAETIPGALIVCADMREIPEQYAGDSIAVRHYQMDGTETHSTGGPVLEFS